jgi:hypothetical protein
MANITKFSILKSFILINLLLICYPATIGMHSHFDIHLDNSNIDAMPAIAYINPDKFVICWTTKVSTNMRIHYAVYDPNGNEKQAPQEVDDNSTGDHDHCQIATDDKGGFAIIWVWRDGSSTCTTTLKVFSRYYNSSFIPGTVIQVNKTINPTYCSYDYRPSVIYANSVFVGCYGSVLQKFDSLIADQGRKSVENPKTKIRDENCVMLNLNNGNIAVSYATVYDEAKDDKQVFFTILKLSDLSVVTNLASVTTTYTGKQEMPSMAYVNVGSNKLISVVWLEASSNVLQNLYEVNGTNTIMNPNKINSARAGYPVVTSLGLDGSIYTYVVYGMLAYHHYNTDGSESERNITSATSTSDLINVAFKPGSTLIMVRTYNNLAQAHIFDITNAAVITNGPCSDFSVITSLKDSKMQISFNSSISTLYITSLVLNGNLIDNSNTPLSVNTQYPSNNIYYSYTNSPQSDSFQYKANSGDTPCTVTLTPCYNSCYSCTTVGNVNDNQCTLCRKADNYFPLQDKSTQCYSNKPVGYYLFNSVWTPCYVNCKDCDQYPADPTIDMKCTVCNTGYYPKEDSMSNCYSGTVTGYHFYVNIYKKDIICDSTCQTCNQPSTSSTPNCTTCITNYFPKEDNLTSCFTGDIPQYCLDNNIYKKCYSTCQTCKGLGTDSDHKCSSCIFNYFPKADQPTSCFTGGIPQYCLDNNIYKKCYSTCQTCKGLGTDSDHKCSSCITNYFPKVDQLTSCFTGDIPQYYFDEKIYQKCFYLCKSCSLTGTPLNNQCTSCLDNYYPKEDYSTNCYTGDQPRYYLDNGTYKRCYNTCGTCNTQGDDIDHQCASCLGGYYSKVDSPLSNCYSGSQSYYYLDTDNVYQKCYPTCLACSTLGISSNHNCITCVDNYYPKVDNPTSCFTGQQQGYTLIGTVYQLCDSNCVSDTPSILFFNLVISCDPSPCLNNGQCSIKLDKVNCECASAWTGRICQYEINNINLNNIINKYYQTQSEDSILDLISVLTSNPSNNNSNLNELFNNLSIFLLI